MNKINHFLKTKKKKIGVMKDELDGKAKTEFTGER